MVKKKAAKKIAKKKKWFDIALPQSLKGTVFSQGYAETPEDLIGRTVKISLGEAISSPMKKHINLTLKIDSVKTSTAQTEIKSLQVSPSYLLRKSKKNSKISAKAVGKTQDEFYADVSICAITNGHCISTAKKEIRKILSDYLKNIIENSKKEALIANLINNSAQLSIKKSINKIFPTKSIELEKIKIK